MAAFLNRGLSRVAQEQTGIGPDIPGVIGPSVDVVSESILVPGTPGTGLTQYVKADARVTLFSVDTGCPCQFRFVLTDGLTDSAWARVQAEAGAGGGIDDTYTLSWVFARPAGSTATITLRASLYDYSSLPPAGTSYNVGSAQVILTTFPTAADGAVGTLGTEQAPPAARPEPESPNQ